MFYPYPLSWCPWVCVDCWSTNRFSWTWYVLDLAFAWKQPLVASLDTVQFELYSSVCEPACVGSKPARFLWLNKQIFMSPPNKVTRCVVLTQTVWYFHWLGRRLKTYRTFKRVVFFQYFLQTVNQNPRLSSSTGNLTKTKQWNLLFGIGGGSVKTV